VCVVHVEDERDGEGVPWGPSDQRSDCDRAALPIPCNREEWGRFGPRLALGGTITSRRHPQELSITAVAIIVAFSVNDGIFVQNECVR